MPRIGPYPSSAPGGGVLAPDTARATSIGQFNQPTWATKVRIGLGRAGSANASVQAAIWTFQGGHPGPLLWAGNPKVIATYMDTQNPGGTGQAYEWSVTGLLVPAGVELAGGAYNAGSSTAGFWQDNSGARMWTNNGATSLPNPFAHDTNSPQGRISISVEGITNRRPDTPSVVAPVEGSSVASQTPSIVFFAHDPDEEFGDEIDKARVEVWNTYNTAIIQDTGWVDPGSGGGLNLYSVALASLDPGNTYRARIYVRDLAGFVSEPAHVTFTVVSAGTWSSVTVGSIAGSTSDGINVATSTTPTLAATWQHPDGLDSSQFEVRIVNHQTGAVYRGPYTYVVTTPVGWVVPFSFTLPEPDWAPMARGATPYRYEIRGTDTDGAVGPWIPSQPFKVNAIPTVSSKSPADLLTVSSAPTFWATISDATDDSPTMRNMGFEVEHIDSSTTITIPAEWNSDAARWDETKDVTHRLIKSLFFASNSYDDYRWRVVGEDPWGEPIIDSWRTFTYAEPPDITMTSPTNGATIATGTPTLSFTSDRTLTQYRVRLFRDDIDSQVNDSGIQGVATSSFSYNVPSGVLRNKVTYRIEVWVKAADGLEHETTFTFTLEYASPEQVHDVVGYAVASSIFDNPGHGIPSQKPNVRLQWSPPSGPDIDRQVIIRISPNGQNRFWWIDDLTTGVFEDPTPAGKMEHEYYIGYTKKMNDGVDTVMSTLVLTRVYVDIKYTTITSENPDDPAVTLHFWRDRQARRIHDKQALTVMGLKAPIGFQGELDHMMIDGEFRALDHDEQAFSARDVVDTVTELAQLRDLSPTETVINVIRQILGSDTYIGRTPRTLYYRDPNQRSVPMMIMMGPDEVDEHDGGRASYRIQGVEVASDIQYDAYVNTDDIIDMTGAIEPTMLLPLDGSLEGLDRSGDFTATGSGALRFVEGMNGYPASRNLVRNPSFEDGTINGTSIADTGVVRSITTEDAYRGTHAFRVDSDGTDSGFEAGVYNASIDGLNTMGGAYTSQIRAKVPAGYTCYFTHRVYYTDGTSAQLSQMDEQVATGDWQYFEVTNYPRSDKILDRILVLFKVRNVTSPMYYLLDACQTERGEVATPYFDGDSGPGHGWEGTQHDSASYREAWVHGGAAVVEESTTNYDTNPISANVAHNNNGYAHVSVSRITDAGLVLPSGVVINTATRIEVTSAPANGSMIGYNATGGTFPSLETGVNVSHGCFIRPSADLVGKTAQVRLSEIGGSIPANTNSFHSHVLVEGWQYVSETIQVKGDDRTGVYFYVNLPGSGDLINGQSYIDFTYCQSENNPYLTSLCPQFDRDGNLIPGYSWSGTAHASASTRQLSYAQINPLTDFPFERGSAIARFRFHADTADRRIFQIGAPGANGLLLRSSGSSLQFFTYAPSPNSITITGAVPEEWITVYCEWGDGEIGIQRNGGAMSVTPGPSPLASSVINIGYGSGRAANADIDALVFFNRKLTENERQRAFEQPEWRWNSIQSDEPEEE